MASWLVHTLRTATAAVPLALVIIAVLTLGRGGVSSAGLPATPNLRLAAVEQPVTPIPRAAHAPALGATPAPTDTATASPTPTVTATATPTAEPTDWIRTTVYVTAGTAGVVAGQSITITPQLIVTGTCGFPIYDVTLNQEPPLFAYSDPMDKVVRGGSASWRLTAFAAGATTFTAVFYGETYCNGVWQWDYASGTSEPVTVTGDIFGLPAIGARP